VLAQFARQPTREPQWTALSPSAAPVDLGAEDQRKQRGEVRDR